MADLELGNMMFNTNANQKYDCPDYIVALLSDIESELDRVMWNLNQEEYPSPFDNTANVFENDVFKVEAYDWNEDSHQEYNFIYYVDKTKANIDDIKISWYKYLGRDTTINQKLDPDIIIDMYNACIASIREMNVKE